MRVVGLITEYNPFHNGHKHHAAEAKRMTGADYVIAVMSGDFVQRGTPAIIDKYSRTRMALNNGVDLVLELPVCFATGSAEIFAHGAVALLNALGVVDDLCFGSEAGDINQLKQAADLMLQPSKLYEVKIQESLKSGLSYPAARQKALLASTRHLPEPDRKSISDILTEPNNILGIEYLKALHLLSSNIHAFTIPRKAAHYHDEKISSNVSSTVYTGQESEFHNINSMVISSATAIRKAIPLGDGTTTDLLNNIETSVPSDVYKIIKNQYLKTCPITTDDFTSIIKYKLLTENSRTLASYMDITNDLADRMKNISNNHLSIEALTNQIKTKNLTLTRVSRALIHLLLNIYTEDMNVYKAQGYSSYARVLGIRREAFHLLKKIQETSSVPVITKVSKADEILSPTALRMFTGDIFASHLYQQAVYEKYHTVLPNEYRQGIILV